MTRTKPLTNTEVKQKKPIIKGGKPVAKEYSDSEGFWFISGNSIR